MMERFVEVGLILGLLWIWSRYYQRACRVESSAAHGPKAKPMTQAEIPEEPAAVRKTAGA